MKEKILYALWGFLYVLCVGLGTFESPEGVLKIALILISLVFFVPGVLLLSDAVSAGDRKGILRVRIISIVSLSLTLLTLVAFILTSTGDGTAAQVFYDVLILVSSPMVCSQYWLLSMFLWSCLLCGSFYKKKG